MIENISILSYLPYTKVKKFLSVSVLFPFSIGITQNSQTTYPTAFPSLLLLFLLFSFLSPSTAEIKSLTITSDSRPMILLEKFGFTHTGHVTISVIPLHPTSPQPDPSRLGFFLLNEESLFKILLEIQQNLSLCVLDSHYITRLFTFRHLSPSASLNHSSPVLSPNEFSLFFSNCAPDTSVSMSLTTQLFNLETDGSINFLSTGQSNLPSIYLIFAIAYFEFLAVWAYICYSNKLSLQRIHLLMAALLIVKALNLVSAAEEMHYAKVFGTPHGWDIPFYIFQFIRVVLLFTVIILIGTEWSFLKPFLEGREKKVLMIVISLQVVANSASVVIGETGPFNKDWVTWNQIFLLVDIICCCAVIFPIFWSIRSLRETSKTDGKAARNLAKLTLFRQFYIVVIGYLFFTRIVVFALGTIASYKYQWISNFAEEAASLAFYVIMFYMFRPVEKNEYFVLDEEEAAEMALSYEEF